MGFLQEIADGLGRWRHQSQIGAGAALFEQRVGSAADQAQPYSDAGSFRSQLDRLFRLASAADVAEFETLAQGAVTGCLSNRYYKPADCLSDVIDALESLTFLGGDPDGEPGIAELAGPGRLAKLKRVREAWLVPIKLAALEGLLAAYARHLGRTLPYAAMNRFERQAARVFALVGQSEAALVERRLSEYVAQWLGRKQRDAEPAQAMERVLGCLEGELEAGEAPGLRVRAAHQPLRLSTVVPEERQQLLEIALGRLGPLAPAAAPVSPAAVAASAMPPAAAPRPRARPAAPARAQADTGPEVSGPLLLLFECPKCGAGFSADDETVSVSCAYCDSLLILTAAQRDEVYIDDDRFADAADVLDTLIQYRVEAHRAECVSRWRRSRGDTEQVETPPEPWIQAQLEKYARRLRETSRVDAAHRVYVPYWHLGGAIVQGALGRHQHGPKLVRVRAFAVEHTQPGYDLSRFDLRDRGLRLAHSRVRPLGVEQVRRAGAFLPWLPPAEGAQREVDKWRGQDLEPGFEPVAKHGELLFAHRVVVYRPYWLAHVVADRGAEWVLADGAFRTLGGYPTAAEVEALVRACVADPLRSGEASFRRVSVIASRCPDCGHQQRLERGASVVVCPNCHRALAPTADGIVLMPCDHVAAEGGLPEADYLPFWRCSFALELPGAPVIRDLRGLRATLFPERTPPGFDPAGDRLWIPAFRLLGSEPGDEAFKLLCEWLHARPLPVADGKLPVGVGGRAWGAALGAADAARLGRFVLLALHSTAAAAALGTLVFKSRLAQPRLTLSDPRLTLVPFQRAASELCLPGTPVRIPRLLVEGGRELEALQASVHRIRRPS